MAMPGGSADKFGNRFEGRWTIRCMLHILLERAQDIWLEMPGDEGKGTEFRITDTAGKRIYHQVKRQQSDRGVWSLSDLKTEGVLTTFWNKLQDGGAECVFASTQSAFPLDRFSDRAREAGSWEEFERNYLTKSDESKFNSLMRFWGDPPRPLAIDALKRIYVEPVREPTLQSNNETMIESLVEGNPSTISGELAQLILANVGHKLTGYDIWNYLDRQGMRPRQWGQDRHVIKSMRETTEHYTTEIKQMLIAGQLLVRREVPALVAMLQHQSHAGILLTGEAGIGKSGVLGQLVAEVKALDWPVLAFRVDRLEPTYDSKNVGEQLLGRQGSPASILASIACNDDSLLVIDQLDSASLASGRNPDFFACIAQIIEHAKAYPNMRVVLACRRFDIDNDQRIRALVKPPGRFEVFQVPRLTEATVLKVVSEQGLDAGKLDPKQLELLSLPLHLRLLAETAQQSFPETLRFRTSKQLFDHFWACKRNAMRLRLGRAADQWTLVINTLTSHMVNHRSLSVPEYVLDPYQAEAQAMASEHVLVYYDRHYAFFHDGFFDYAYARSLLAQGEHLLPLLRSREQHLFYRAVVRQVLLYERAADADEQDRYLADLKGVILSDDIRFHLKQVAFALLSELQDPTLEEWRMLHLLIVDPGNSYAHEIEGVLTSSPQWFQLLDSQGVVAEWLAGSRVDLQNLAMDVLTCAQTTFPDRVSQLLEPYWRAPGWASRILRVLRCANISVNRASFDIVLYLIDQDVFAGRVGSSVPELNFWTLIHFLADQHPEWACEAIGHFLSCELGAPRTDRHASQSSILDADHLTDPELGYLRWDTCAARAPAAYVQHILPCISNFVEMAAPISGPPPWVDPIWKQRHFGQTRQRQFVILEATVHALELLARTAPEDFEKAVAPLENATYDTFQYLLCCSYAANPVRFADRAIDYLCADPAHLRTGYVENCYWATRELIQAVSPHCSADKLEQLEKMLLQYDELPEDTTSEYGCAQLIFLEGIAPQRRSKRVKQRLQYLGRKYGGSPPPPQSAILPAAESPISQQVAAQMSNEDWLKAIATYSDNGDSKVSFREDGRIVSDAYYLSMRLESQVKDDPARFARLAVHLPRNTNPHYATAILRGLAESTIDTRLLLGVCQWAHGLPGRPCGRWLCEVIAAFAASPLPEELLRIVIWYATEDADPLGDEHLLTFDGHDSAFGGIITMAGFDTSRGAAAAAIGRLILYDRNRLDLLIPTIQKLVSDRSVAVRSCVAAALEDVLMCDTPLAIKYFLQLYETEERLLGTPTAESFMMKALETNCEDLIPLLCEMLSAQGQDVQEVGCRVACHAGLVSDGAHDLVERFIAGSTAMRINAARTFAGNVHIASRRDTCTAYLIKLFQDSDRQVSQIASTCFEVLVGPQLAEYQELIEAFVSSSAVQATPLPLLRALWACPAISSDLVCKVGEQLIDRLGSDLGLNLPFGAWTEMLSGLMLRAYRNSADEALQMRCLNVIDDLAHVRAYGLDAALAQYDR